MPEEKDGSVRVIADLPRPPLRTIRPELTGMCVDVWMRERERDRERERERESEREREREKKRECDRLLASLSSAHCPPRIDWCGCGCVDERERERQREREREREKERKRKRK